MSDLNYSLVPELVHGSLGQPKVVQSANSILEKAVIQLTALELRDVSLNWKMIHLGQGFYDRRVGSSTHLHREIQTETVLEGVFRFTDQEGSVDVQAGQTLVIQPGHKHSWVCINPGYMLGGLIKLKGPAKKSFLEFLSSQHAGMKLLDSSKMRGWHEKLISSVIEVKSVHLQTPSAAALLQLMLIEVLEEIIDFETWTPLDKQAGQISMEREESICKHAIDFIDENYPYPIQLKDISMEVGLSSRHLSRVFQQNHGQSPNEYLLEKRMEEALLLLKNNVTRSIKEVAIACGFANPAYFSSSFKKKYGMKPGEARR